MVGKGSSLLWLGPLLIHSATARSPPQTLASLGSSTQTRTRPAKGMACQGGVSEVSPPAVGWFGQFDWYGEFVGSVGGRLVRFGLVGGLVRVGW